MPRQKEEHVQTQGGMTTQALSFSRTLTRPDVCLRKIGLELQAVQSAGERAAEGREARKDCVGKKAGYGVHKPGSKPSSTTW